jgi:hypothetical protein
MNEDLAAVKVWLAERLAHLCKMADDDSLIIEVAVMASKILKESYLGTDKNR